MTDILTARDVMTLAEIISMTQRNAKIARDMSDDILVYGHARSIGDENFCADFRNDIRDQYLRVTTRGGMEYAWPVADLVKARQDGAFAEMDW